MPTALITGASAGIGLELARVFAREKYRVVLVARNQKRLEEIAQELRPADSQVLAIDLSLPGAPEEIHGKAPKVDVLVNNAGFGLFGKFVEKGLAEELNMMQLNMTALVALTRLYLPGMIAAGGGKVMNVASTAAFQPGPLMAIYYATKAFVLSFSEAIGNELEGTGVIVSTLCPGPTTSDFQERAQMQKSGLVKGRKMMDARTVAEAGYRGLMAGKTVVIPGLANKLMAQSIRFSPRSMVTKVVRRIQEER
jgi:short-subunit dehydrogenase